jgi:2-polyprenyl-3-methyl-5-hydroxy-6-metoxy-1,4-benzoquinol methylase
MDVGGGALAKGMKQDARRYETEVDPSAEKSAAAQLVLLTGENKVVLEIGPATGYISNALKERGCTVTGVEIDPEAAEIARSFADEMIVANVEKLDFGEAFSSQRFDVVMFGDVLEHLVDPKNALEKARGVLSDVGYVVASIPNVAHSSVRLMLLDGKFGYTEKGLLDYTHLRFFTREGMHQLFESAGYEITSWKRIETDGLSDPFAEDLRWSAENLPGDLIRALEHDPVAHTYQFGVTAVPSALGRRDDWFRSPQATENDGSVLAVLRRLETERAEAISDLQTALHEKSEHINNFQQMVAEKDKHIKGLEVARAAEQEGARRRKEELQVIHQSLAYRVMTAPRVLLRRVGIRKVRS